MGRSIDMARSQTARDRVGDPSRDPSLPFYQATNASGLQSRLACMTVCRVRGFPLLQLLLVAAVFIGAGIPVWSLTRPAAGVAAPALVAPATTPAASATGQKTLTIETTFAPAPADFQVQCQDQTVLEGHGPSRQFSIGWKTVLPKEGVDLVVRANWPAQADAAAGPAAARVVVHLPDGSTTDKSFWTAPGQSLAEVITVPGSVAATPASIAP